MNQVVSLCYGKAWFQLRRMHNHLRKLVFVLTLFFFFFLKIYINVYHVHRVHLLLNYHYYVVGYNKKRIYAIQCNNERNALKWHQRKSCLMVFFFLYFGMNMYDFIRIFQSWNQLQFSNTSIQCIFIFGLFLRLHFWSTSL